MIEGKNIDYGAVQTEDERRLQELGYKQEVKRIFGTFTNFGLSASMISVLLGVIPLYTYQLQVGGSAVMIWSWVVVGIMSMSLVISLSEICSAYPTMGALYFWAYKLGGPEWGPFAAWIAGWCNLLGQIAGVASGGYAGAEILGNIIMLSRGVTLTNVEILALYAFMLVVAGVVNTFAETMLTALCYISVAWQNIGILCIVITMWCHTKHFSSLAFVLGDFNNATNFTSPVYVALIGCLTAASVFTGYDTGAHVAEETVNSHQSTPRAMIFAVLNAFVFGLVLIIGMNVCITDQTSLFPSVNDDGSGAHQAYTLLWQQTVGTQGAVAFLVITIVAIECSNCANLTSAARMVYSMSRDGALPLSRHWYHIDPNLGGPVRAIWVSLAIAFLLGVPGLTNKTILGALFSLTATGLYSSYLIPILLRVTVGRESFEATNDFNLGRWSVPLGCVACVWGTLMVVILCLAQDTPVTVSNVNYSPIALGTVLLGATVAWITSAKHWFKIQTLVPTPSEAQFTLCDSSPHVGFEDGGEGDGSEDLALAWPDGDSAIELHVDGIALGAGFQQRISTTLGRQQRGWAASGSIVERLSPAVSPTSPASPSEGGRRKMRSMADAIMGWSDDSRAPRSSKQLDSEEDVHLTTSAAEYDQSEQEDEEEPGARSANLSTTR